MPTTAEAVDYILEKGMLFCPAKSVNAGGVAVSGLEMSQDAGFTNWSAEEVDNKLQHIMQSIFDNAIKASEKAGQKGNLLVGANLGGFLQVADAMIAQGCV